MPVSLSAVWGTTTAFVRREADLLLPLTMAFLAVARVGTDYAQAAMKGGNFDPAAIFLLGISTVMLVTGLAAIRALVLFQGSSVGEAILLGFRRLPKILALWLLMMIVLLGATAPILAVDAGTKPSGLAAMIALVGMLGYLYLNARLFCYSAIIVDRNPPIAQAIAQSWQMTKPHHLSLLGLIFLFQLSTEAVGGGITQLLSLALQPLENALGATGVADLMAALAGAIVSSFLILFLTVFSAIYYQRSTAD